MTFKEPEFKNHYSYYTGGKQDKEKSYIRKVYEDSCRNKVELRKEVIEETREIYEEAKNAYNDLLKWESMEEDKIFEVSGNVEEEIKAIQSIDPNLIFAKINKARLQVQRILELYEDVYIVCHMTSALKLQHEKLKDLHEQIEKKIEERQEKIDQEELKVENQKDQSLKADKEDRDYARNIRKEEEESIKRNFVETS